MNHTNETKVLTRCLCCARPYMRLVTYHMFTNETKLKMPAPGACPTCMKVIADVVFESCCDVRYFPFDRLGDYG